MWTRGLRSLPLTRSSPSFPSSSAKPMLSWSFEFEDREYFEGFRSLATNGVDKPILNLFRMLGLMSGDRVSAQSTGSVPLDEQISAGVRRDADVDALATRSGNSAAVLMWN